MKKWISSVIFLAAAVVTLWGIPVKEVRIEGLKNIDKDFILSVCHSVEGTEFSVIKLRQDIENMYDLGYFDRIDVRAENADGGIVVIYSVRERPFIRNITIRGNKKYDDTKILYEAPFLVEDVPFDSKYLHQAKYNIEKKYKENGYFLVNVTATAEEVQDGVNLVIDIDEGSKLSIGTIRFKGLKELEPKKLKKAMESKESSWWRHPKLDTEKLDGDMTLIEEKLWEMGYFNASAEGYEIVPSRDPGRRDIIITLNEGKRYRLGEITFEGNELFKDEELRDMVSIGPGEYFTGDDWEKAKVKLLEAYGNRSHIFADITPRYTFHDETVDVTLFITEGSAIRVGTIEVRGNTKTYDKIILRNILLRPGDEFKRNLLVLSQEQIYNLGYFEDVRVLPRPDEKDPNILNIIIEVDEKLTGSINLGGSYSEYSGFSMFLKYEEQNILGRGYKGSIQFEIGKKVETYQLGFTNPNLFDSPTYVSTNLYKKDQDYTDYTILRNGGSLTVGRKLNIFTSGYLSYSLESVEVTDVSEEAAQEVDETKEFRSSASLTFARDSRDNRFEPTRGTHNTITGELGGKFLGGDVNYYKVEATSNWFFRSFWKFVFSVYMQTGFVEKLDPSTEVPIYERFFVGGNIYGVRGYEDKALSPLDDDGYYKGGNFYFTTSFSYKFPIVERMITGYLFWDVGRAWETLGDFNFRDMRDGAGIGVKVTTPMGPLTLDYAYGFDTEQWKFHFGISQGTF